MTGIKRHTAKMFVHRRRCPMAVSSHWCWYMSVINVCDCSVSCWRVV